MRCFSRILVSIGLDPMGPTTASYKSQPVERSSPSGLPGWKQRLDGSTVWVDRNDPELLSLLTMRDSVLEMKPANRFRFYHAGTFGKYGVADQSLLPSGQAQWRASQRAALVVAGQL